MKTPLSSTSPSDAPGGAPWRCLAPLLCLLAGLVGGAWYLLRVNPQDQLRFRQIHIKNAALERTAGQPRLLVCGDSNVAFGMDPAVLKAVTGLPTVNLGYDAGCGILALLGVADRAARAGDTLVVSFTAELMASALEPVREGRLLAMLYGDPKLALGGTPTLFPDSLAQEALTRLSLCSPSERRILNDLGRLLLRMPGNRYINCAIDENGYFAGKVFLPYPPYEKFPPVNMAWRPVFQAFVARMQQRGVRIFYTLPWLACDADKLDSLKIGAGKYLDRVAEELPVLREPGYGLQTDPSLFADTGAHLSVPGAQQRSRSLGEVLNAQRLRPLPAR